MDPQDAPDRRRLRRNAALLCGFSALHVSLFPIAILTLFLRDLGLQMFDVFVLQAMFGLEVALLEFPSGYMADRVGYRRTLLIGALAGALAWSVYSLAAGFWSAALAELLLAVSVSFVSGTDSALLYESLLALGEEGSFTLWYGRNRSLGNLLSGTTALVGSFLFVRSARLPFALQALVALGTVFFAFALVEPQRDRGVALAGLARVRALVHYVAFRVPRLRAVVAFSVALSLPIYAMVWVLPAYVEEAGVSAAWLGPIWACSSYAMALCTLCSPWLGRRLGLGPALALCVALLVLGYFGMGLTYATYGFVFYVALSMARGIQLPLAHAQEQLLIPSSDRAGLLSLNSLLFRGAFVLVGPVVGYALDHAEHHAVLLSAGGCFAALAAGAWLWLVGTPQAEVAPQPL
jgi:MFS family permease